ncbi:UDP-N-acetylglucosamine 2-epimerase [Aquihabitans sp. McL0605]|uniref:UDP-N-acetylglucosamine 2-epimerase n=1 Tax=Aquihabitans sp. McL0605 TaxID=3415671 RepID=UPI003CF03EE0
MSADATAGGAGPPRQVWFLTGTRADFGKLKPLILAAAAEPGVEVTVVATGMHLLDLYGYTVLEVRRLPPPIRVREFANQPTGATMDVILAETTASLGRMFNEHRPDLLVVHGDRVEALAGAAVGALRGVPVAHVEGGERSGTIDGVLRHAISKLSHLHLVANDEAARRILQLGEVPSSVRVLGSPDIDVMVSGSLPDLDAVRASYAIPFDRYVLVLFHSVTTEPDEAAAATAQALLAAVDAVGLPAVVVYPNNDPGGQAILDVYRSLDGRDGYRVFPSIRFEAFLTLLAHAEVLIGNSSAGIREAPFYGVPTVNIGSRQRDRFHHRSIHSCDGTVAAISAAITAALEGDRVPAADHFGAGDSAGRFVEVLRDPATWSIDLDKRFLDLDAGPP